MSRQEEWDKINQWIKQDPKRLGDSLKEYVEESIHGGWDGFSSRDLTGIRRLLLDLVTFDQNRQ